MMLITSNLLLLFKTTFLKRVTPRNRYRVILRKRRRKLQHSVRALHQMLRFVWIYNYSFPTQCLQTSQREVEMLHPKPLLQSNAAKA